MYHASLPFWKDPAFWSLPLALLYAFSALALFLDPRTAGNPLISSGFAALVLSVWSLRRRTPRRRLAVASLVILGLTVGGTIVYVIYRIAMRP